MCDFSRVSAWFCDEKFSLKKVVSTFTSGGDMSLVGTRHGKLSDEHIKYYELRARGGTGLLYVRDVSLTERMPYGIEYP